MWENFGYAANAILPLVLVIAFGYMLRRCGFIGDTFIKNGYSLVFRVALPVYLFCSVYDVEQLSDIEWRLVLFAMLVVVLLFFIGLLLVLFFVPEQKQKGVVVQCAFRSNFAVVGLPLAEALGGAAGKTAVSVLMAVTIPVFNTLAVVALSVWSEGEGEKIHLGKILKKVVTNPLILSVAAGVLVLAVRHFIPVNDAGQHVFTLERNLPFIFEAVRIIAKLSTPLALLVLGGQFSFGAVKGMARPIAVGTFARIVLAPTVGILLVVLCSRGLNWFDVTAGGYAALVALFGSPVAVSSAIMAGEMGNDDILAGQLVVWTSVGSIFTVFAAVVILRSFGLL